MQFGDNKIRDAKGNVIGIIVSNEEQRKIQQLPLEHLPGLGIEANFDEATGTYYNGNTDPVMFKKDDGTFSLPNENPCDQYGNPI